MPRGRGGIARGRGGMTRGRADGPLRVAERKDYETDFNS